ncbi:MAG: diguanylate cyclase, partial [Ruminiclostridium sp.]|nr:diguanylate cyclase [Ruminiclostridium sp.]
MNVIFTDFALSAVLIILCIVAIFLLLLIYIPHLKKKLELEKRELKAVNGELVAAEMELRKQHDELSRKCEELRLNNERYRLAVDGVNDGIWDWDKEKNEVFISSRCRKMLGYKVNELSSTLEAMIRLIYPDDKEKLLKALESYISSKSKRYFHTELRIKTGTGEYKWVLVKGKAVLDKDGAVIRIAGSLTDINERKMAEEKIHQMAYYDNLTGLPNRTLLLDRFSIAAANAVRKKRMVAVYFLDLDNFKTINDTLGHVYGDELIAKVGKHLREQMRKGDTIARLGGDEFIIMQPNIREFDEVTRMALRLLDSFKQPWILEGREYYVTTSIGVTFFPDDGQDMLTLMKNADTAMYRAKELGKNNFQLYTESLNRWMLEKLGIENDLRKAIERNELIIHYQPQIELKTGRVVCMEALLRWQHPTSG